MKHIEKNLIYRDGRYYDLLSEKTAPDDIPFYLRQVEKYGDPVLELGCGTGRVTIPLAEKGIHIKGLDISESMLAHAKNKAHEKNLEIDFIQADCRDFDLGRKFNLIIFPYNAFHHILDVQSAEACFASVKKHLTETGKFIIDIFNPSLTLLTRDPGKQYPLAEFNSPEGNGKVIMTETPRYDPATQIQTLKWHYNIGGQQDARQAEWDMRIYFPQELDALFKYNGFKIDHKFGNYDETKFVSDSPKQIIVCHT